MIERVPLDDRPTVGLLTRCRFRLGMMNNDDLIMLKKHIYIYLHTDACFARIVFFILSEQCFCERLMVSRLSQFVSNTFKL